MKPGESTVGNRDRAVLKLHAFGALLYCANGGQGVICVSMSQFKR